MRIVAAVFDGLEEWKRHGDGRGLSRVVNVGCFELWMVVSWAPNETNAERIPPNRSD